MLIVMIGMVPVIAMLATLLLFTDVLLLMHDRNISNTFVKQLSIIMRKTMNNKNEGKCPNLTATLSEWVCLGIAKKQTHSANGTCDPEQGI